MSRETKKMARLTREQAKRDQPDERTPEGSHDFPSKARDEGHEHLGQLGVGQSDDVTGTAPASGMARQRANPSRG